jgi:hypothetical protein
VDILGKDAILSRAGTALPTHPVDVPEWGGTVYVRELTARERDDFESGCVVIKGDKQTPNLRNYRGRLAALVIGNDKGGRLFEDDDADQLGELPAAALDKILDVARKVNGMTREATEEAEKN